MKFAHGRIGLDSQRHRQYLLITGRAACPSCLLLSLLLLISLLMLSLMLMLNLSLTDIADCKFDYGVDLFCRWCG